MELMMPNISTLEENDTTGKFVIEPLERGYGQTLGNSLRRVMLSSIEGAAITFVKIDKVQHEFSTIPGVKEDTTELLLNLKDLFIKVDRNATGRDEPKIIRVNKKGEGRITGADVDCPPDIAVVNPEAYIATISDEESAINMELTVEIGKGYVLPDKQERRGNQPIGVIPVGSAFTPVRKVNWTVEATRVGFKTDYERLIMDITTNGTITPSRAMSEAAVILIQYFRKFMEFSGGGSFGFGEGTLALEGHNGPQAPDQRIEELDFSVRTYNCLKKANVLTIGGLVGTTEADLMVIKNFGKKSLVEVRKKLGELGLSLKGGNTVSTDDVDDADLTDEE